LGIAEFYHFRDSTKGQSGGQFFCVEIVDVGEELFIESQFVEDTFDLVEIQRGAMMAIG
jgi:hypothetical protein